MRNQAEVPSHGFFVRIRWRRWISAGVIVLSWAVMMAAGWHGWGMRKDAWDYFAKGRFRPDIRRNYVLGTEALRLGLLNQYDLQQANLPDPQRRLNYTPLRTLVFAQWAKSNGEPDATPHDRDPVWQEDFEFNSFLNHFNMILALLGAVAAGLLVLQWTTHPRDPPMDEHSLMDDPHDDPPRYLHAWPWIAAAIAFAYTWYNPAGLILAHGWPSPNAWVIPFFLWAIVLITQERWFVAGVVIGVGSMFQGQHLLVAPIFVLWPLMAGQPLRALRWLTGFALAAGLIVSGWMLSALPESGTGPRVVRWSAVAWIGISALVLALVPIVRGWMSRPARTPEPVMLPEGLSSSSIHQPLMELSTLAYDSNNAPPHWTARRALIASGVIITCALVLTWPMLRSLGEATGWVMLALLVAAGTGAICWRWGWRATRYALAGVIGAQLLLCMPVYGASTSWLELGFIYGTERHPTMAVGPASNLGGLLHHTFGYRSIHQEVEPIPAGLFMGYPEEPVTMTMRHLLLGIYGITLIIACMAIAIQWRRKDRNFLLAVTLPWLLMAMLPPQMHERYLGFAAISAAVWIGASGGVGWLLTGVGVSFVAYWQIARCMANVNRRTFHTFDQPFFSREFLDTYERLYPALSWPLLVLAGILLFVAFTRSCGSATTHKPRSP